MLVREVPTKSYPLYMWLILRHQQAGGLDPQEGHPWMTGQPQDCRRRDVNHIQLQEKSVFVRGRARHLS